MAARVTDFMQCCPMPVDRFEIGLRRWDLHEVMPRVVECALAAYPEIHTGRTDQRLGLRQHEASLDRRRDRRHLVGQPFALRRVEHGESLQEWDRLRFLAGLGDAPTFVIRHEPVGKDDGRAALTLADMATETECLAEGQPALAGKTALYDSAPEDEDVNPGVTPVGRGIPGHGERRLHRRRSPRLDPWRAACLQLGDDLVGDFVIKACPVLAGPRRRCLSRHRRSPRRAPEAPPPALNPSRQTRSALSLYRGRCGGLPRQKARPLEAFLPRRSLLPRPYIGSCAVGP